MQSAKAFFSFALFFLVSKELIFFSNILRGDELKFESNLGCRAKNSLTVDKFLVYESKCCIFT